MCRTKNTECLDKSPKKDNFIDDGGATDRSKGLACFTGQPSDACSELRVCTCVHQVYKQMAVMVNSGASGAGVSAGHVVVSPLVDLCSQSGGDDSDCT